MTSVQHAPASAVRRLSSPSDVRRMLLGHALASVGMSLPWPLLLVLVWDRTHSDLLLGATGAARMLPYVAFSWAAGRLADARRRDQVVLASVIARVIALVIVAAAIGLGQLPLAVLAAAAAVAAGTPAYPALAAALPDVAGPRTDRATELLVTVEVASFVVGPALGGLLLWPPTRSATPAVAVALVAAAWCVLRPVRLPAPTREPGEPARPRLRASVRGGVLATIVLMSAVNFVGALVAIALLPLAERLWAGDAATYGVATGVLGFGALGGPLLARLGRTDGERIRWGLVLLGLTLGAVAAAPAVAWAVAPLAVAGGAAVHVEASATRLLQQAVPDRLRASAFGLADSAMVGAALVGSLAGPVLAGLVDPRTLLAGLAAATILASGAAKSKRWMQVSAQIR